MRWLLALHLLLTAISWAAFANAQCAAPADRDRVLSCGSLEGELINVTSLNDGEKQELRRLHGAACKPTPVSALLRRAQLLAAAQLHDFAAVAYAEIARGAAATSGERHTRRQAMEGHLENLVDAEGDGCTTELETEAARYHAAICRPVEEGGDDLCERLTRIRLHLAQAAVNHDQSRAAELRRAQADGLLALYEELDGDAQCRAGIDTCEAFSIALFNAARLYQLAGARLVAANLWRRLLGLGRERELHARAHEALAFHHVAIADYRAAIQHGLALARAFPKHENTPDLLGLATQLQVGIGDVEGATRSVQLFHRLYGRKSAESAALLTLDVVHRLELRGEAKAADGLVHRSFLGFLARHATPEQLLRGQVAYARKRRRAGEDASQAYARVVTAAAGLPSLSSGLARDALGEALAFAGDRLMEKVEAALARRGRFPASRAAAVRQQLAEAETAYAALLDHPTPSARWLIRVRERLAAAHQRLASRANDAEAKARARAHYTRCLADAQRLQQLDAPAARCRDAVHGKVPLLGPRLRGDRPLDRLHRRTAPLPDPRPANPSS